MIVDILLAVGERGGGENVIKSVKEFGEKKQICRVRVIQLVWEGIDWLQSSDFFPLLYGRKGHTLEEFVERYTDFLKNNDLPDLVLATAWPYMCYVGKMALALCGKKNVKVISWMHNQPEEYIAAGFGGYDYLALADGHLAISTEICRKLENNLPIVNKIERVYNPTVFPKKELLEKRKNEEETRVIKFAFVGRLAPEKKVDIIIRGFAQTQYSKLVIVGDGEKQYKEMLLALAEENSVSDRIEWLGWREKPWEELKDISASVIASEREGSSLSIVESLAWGIPVLTTPAGDVGDIVNFGINGYLYPFNDWKSLGKIMSAMEEKLAHKIDAEECRNSVGQYEYNHALTDFWEKIKKFI